MTRAGMGNSNAGCLTPRVGRDKRSIGGSLGFCHGHEPKLCNLRSYKLSGRWEEGGK
jgi:hypothetical protein